MRNLMPYAMVALTILFTVCGQFLIKWQVGKAGALPTGLHQQARFCLELLLNPWIITAFASAFLASIAWMLAMTKLPLSHAHPMMSLTFVVVVFGSALIFNESITPLKVAGLVLILAGVAIGSQG